MTIENFADDIEIDISTNGKRYDPCRQITHDMSIEGKAPDGTKLRKVFPAGTPKKEVDLFFANLKKSL